MPKPVCVPCQRFFRPDRNGVTVLEGKPESGALPGTSEASRWHPYKLWYADRWKCQGCGTEIITGFGPQPAMQDFKNSDAEMRAAAKHLVNDC